MYQMVAKTEFVKNAGNLVKQRKIQDGKSSNEDGSQIEWYLFEMGTNVKNVPKVSGAMTVVMSDTNRILHFHDSHLSILKIIVVASSTRVYAQTHVF